MDERKKIEMLRKICHVHDEEKMELIVPFVQYHYYK